MLDPNRDIGSFRLLERVATSPLSEVFRARRRWGSAEAAVKRYRGHERTVPGTPRLFLERARLAARWAHPRIVRTLEFGWEAQGGYIATEWFAGRSLRRVMEKGVPLSPWWVSHIGAQIADALSGSADLIHRDVTPDNILVSPEGEVRLCDLGSMIRVGCTWPGEGVGGKTAYLSPEQAAQRPLDPRSDQFALGIILWELLTARRLFWRSSPYATLRAIRTETKPEVPRTCPAPLESAVRRLLARDPAERYPSAHLVRDALRRCRDASEHEERPTEPLYETTPAASRL